MYFFLITLLSLFFWMGVSRELPKPESESRSMRLKVYTSGGMLSSVFLTAWLFFSLLTP